MDILEKGKLADGRIYVVIRVITPDPEVPEERKTGCGEL